MENSLPAPDLAPVLDAENALASAESALDSSLATIQETEARLLRAVDQAIDDLRPKIDLLGKRISETREHLFRLLKNPIPAAQFAEFISGYIDALAKKGEQEVFNYLNGRVANVEDMKSHVIPRNVYPLSYEQAHALVSGNSAPGLGSEQLRSVLPTIESGGLSPEVQLFVFGDQVKAKLIELLERRPVTYHTTVKGGFQVGTGMAERYAEVEQTRSELAALEAEHAARAADMSMLMLKKRGKR